MTLPRVPAPLVAALLVASAVNLALMVPGGLVETRSFPGYGVSTLAAFNVFLTVLGLGSLLLGYHLWRGGRAGLWPLLAGIGYVAVYLADLGHVFPISATPMSATLLTLEWIGTLLGAALIAAAAARVATGNGAAATPARLPAWLLLTLAALTLAIVLFATVSAM